MFAVIKIKPYKNTDYVFVTLRKIVNNKNLTRNKTYSANVKDWIYEKNDTQYYCMKYYLNKV